VEREDGVPALGTVWRN